jgi:hypothetical protein
MRDKTDWEIIDIFLLAMKEKQRSVINFKAS